MTHSCLFWYNQCMSQTIKAEYIWLDGYTPEPNLRSKTKIVHMSDGADPLKFEYPEWSFDGSSTLQAEGSFSDCILRPVCVKTDGGRKDAVLVLCEVYLPDGKPHPSNTRNTFEDMDDMWFGFEQEYVLVDSDSGLPLAFPHRGYPEPQGKYYCGVGHPAVTGRDIVEEHLEICLNSGLGITGINAEVMLGQWEFQAFGKGAKAACDNLWLARYLLFRITEKYNIVVEFHPKPVKGDWNGSGLHCNFSNSFMRTQGGKEYFDKIFEVFEKNHIMHIENYGSSNDQRLTGNHETSPITEFSTGVSNRGCSIRIPLDTHNNQQGYLEDRRPASNADPYRIARAICTSVQEVVDAFDFNKAYATQ